MPFKKLEGLGGIGSILTGFVCVWIGVTDYQDGQAWKIWAVMTVALVVNGLAMLRHAAKRPDPLPSSRAVNDVAKAGT